jgi:hypothetical protein
VALNPVTNKIYVPNDSSDDVTVIDEAPAFDTQVRVEVDSLPGHQTLLARPDLSGKAVNRLTPFRNVMMGVGTRIGSAQLPWVFADVTQGAGTDSVTWTFAWATDSLMSGENFVCVMPFEMDAAVTNNEGLGSPLGGNIVVYPVYRTWGVGVAEPPAAASPLRSFGATVLRGVLVLKGDCPRTGTVPKADLLDASGRKMLDLRPGANDVRALAPGVYFVREAQAQAQAQAQAVRKVVITR